MATKTETDGQDPGQEADPKDGDEGGEESGSETPDPNADLKAEIGLLHDSVAEIRQAILSGRQSAPAPVEEEINDDEPLTASKVNKIVNRSITQAVSQSNQTSQRGHWDEQAKKDFPLTDPKFLREFKREWTKQCDSGLDPKHPKAVYTVAEITAIRAGSSRAPARETKVREPTPEPSSRENSRASSQRVSKSSISDNDPRVKLYAMKGTKSKEQIEGFKQKLAAKEAQGVRR